MRNIVNIVNFVRCVEPRRPMNLMEPVLKQVKLLRENNMKGTFLLQYDTIVDPEFQKLFISLKDEFELGLWFEIVEPQVEAIGLKWRGRFPWDWYSDVGFLIGYEPEERRLLIDEAMRKFREVFGYLPKSVGSWHMDAVSLKWLSDKYNVDAACICRDQVGTDGYTIQGGYYNQAYYPSKYNMLCPANSLENQVNLPVFRMLGSDPVHAYDYQIIDYSSIGISAVPTLEPAQSSYNTEYSDWLINEIFNGSGMCFQYTQVGQENSFGWEKMREGLSTQFRWLKKAAERGEVEIQTLAETGRMYKAKYKTTPPAVVSVLNEWKREGRKSVWFSGKYYRANLHWVNGKVYLRDIYMFRDTFGEEYLDKRCTTNACGFRNLPVMDGSLFTGGAGAKMAGIYFADENGDIVFDLLEYSETETEACVTLAKGDKKVKITFTETEMKLQSEISDLTLKAVYDKGKFLKNNESDVSTFTNSNNRTIVCPYPACTEKTENSLKFSFCGFEYGIFAEAGRFDSNLNVIPDNGKIRICFDK